MHVAQQFIRFMIVSSFEMILCSFIALFGKNETPINKLKLTNLK